MGFMKPQIIRCTAVEIDTDNGTWWVPEEDLSGSCYKQVGGKQVFNKPGLLQYTEGRKVFVAKRHKNVILARMSAPGYLDCTDWCKYESVAKAEKSLAEDYGDDDDDDDDDLD